MNIVTHCFQLHGMRVMYARRIHLPEQLVLREDRRLAVRRKQRPAAPDVDLRVNDQHGALLRETFPCLLSRFTCLARA